MEMEHEAYNTSLFCDKAISGLHPGSSSSIPGHKGNFISTNSRYISFSFSVLLSLLCLYYLKLMYTYGLQG